MACLLPSHQGQKLRPQGPTGLVGSSASISCHGAGVCGTGSRPQPEAGRVGSLADLELGHM